MSADNKGNFFQYLEESTWQEREAIANELKAMYNRLLENEQISYLDARHEKKGDKHYLKYIEADAKLGIIQGIFDTLHVDYECGKKFDLPEEMTIPFH